MGGRGYKNDLTSYLNGDRRCEEFETFFKLDNDKIDVIQDIKTPKTPTMPIFSNTENKIYAVVGKNIQIKSIGFYDERHMLVKTIHLDHKDNKLVPHVHIGDNYHHESGKSRKLNIEEQEITSKVLIAWKERGSNYVK